MAQQRYGMWSLRIIQKNCDDLCFFGDESCLWEFHIEASCLGSMVSWTTRWFHNFLIKNFTQSSTRSTMRAAEVVEVNWFLHYLPYPWFQLARLTAWLSGKIRFLKWKISRWEKIFGVFSVSLKKTKIFSLKWSYKHLSHDFNEINKQKRTDCSSNTFQTQNKKSWILPSQTWSLSSVDGEKSKNSTLWTIPEKNDENEVYPLWISFRSKYASSTRFVIGQLRK